MTGSKARVEPLQIGSEVVEPGERRRFELPVALLPTHTPLALPLTVIHGARPGPRLWISAAVHGDELNGVEVIRLVLDELGDQPLHGSLVAAPIVNVFGFIQQSRYLPDRRDLNRSFPGSPRGSLAARMANLFMTEIVARCTHGIDLHTATVERTNHPQVRADLHDEETRRVAEAFGAPIMVHSVVRDGSLRGAASKRGIPVLVYEGGEAQRFDRDAIDVGVRGVMGVMHGLGMLRRRPRGKRVHSQLVERSSWVRARSGGLLRLAVDVGQRVEERQLLGQIADPFGEERVILRAPFAGLVIGRTNNPVVHAGDAVVHLGRLEGQG